MSRFYITTAIDFVNSKPHLGTAYEKVCADVIARYHRLIGDETRFQMGNDEHSQNVYRSAVEQGLRPLEYCDRMEEVFTRTWRHLDVSYDDFIRTTEPRHHQGVTTLVQRVFEAGDIYEGAYNGWYCEGCEAFKQDKDLVDGKCPLHPTTALQWIHEKNYFFRLSRFQRPLLEHFSAHPEFLEPEIRRNEILRLIEGGLEDISISRAGQSWGIPLPFDPSSVVYVWFDALANYATAVGLGQDASLFEKWWPASLHVIGKDITRFHTVIWPAMLMSAGLPLPRRVFGHGFMTLNGQRMSKSLGTIVDPIEAADRNGVDPLRLYLVKEITFGNDGDFSWERFDERYNVDLANNLGNLVSRIAAMAWRYCEGRVWATGASATELPAAAERAGQEYRHAMDALAIHEGAAAAFRIVDATNEFIAATTPWTLARDPANADRVRQALFDATEAVRLAAVLLTPIIPSSSREILRRVGAPGPVEFDRDGRWRTDGQRTLTQDGPLWPRKETKEIRVEPKPPSPAVQPGPGSAPSPESRAASPDGRISIDDFMKVELRVAKVLAAERVPKSNRLLKLLVDVGSEQRTIVAGIAESYEPDALIGRTVAIVFNLKPAKLMGVESNGMVLAASPEGGKATLVSFDEPPAPGTRVR